MKVIVVSPIATVAIAKVAAKRARDDNDESDVVEEVLGIKMAAINK